MMIRPAALALIGILSGLPIGLEARTQDPQTPAGGQAPEPAKPDTPAPEQPPPPPPAQVPEPPATKPPTSTQDLPAGQWVHTEQYGWVWMPYGKNYTHVPTDGETPYMYVYYPSDGWCWVIAPWIWGWGPSPYFGIGGPWGYGWWGNGFGMWYGFSYAYWGYGGCGVYHHGGWYYPPSGGHGGSRPLGPPWRGAPSGGASYAGAPRGGAAPYGSAPRGGTSYGGGAPRGGGVRR